MIKNYISIVKNEFDNSLTNKDFIFQNKKPDSPYYYCIIKSKKVKIIFKDIMYSNIYLSNLNTEHINPRYNDPNVFEKYKDLKILTSSMDEAIIEQKIIDSMTQEEYYNYLDNFFTISYGLLNNFPKLLKSTKNLLIFEYIDGVNLDYTNINKNESQLFKILSSNFKILKDNKIYVDYSYNSSDIIIDDNQKIWFVDIENFCPTVVTDWYFIKQYNEDNNFFNSPYITNFLIQLRAENI